MTYEIALESLAVPTRRTILEILKGGEYTVGRIAEMLPVSRPAVSQHLAILADADLVVRRREGTRTYYRLNPLGFDAVRAYVESFWDDVLSRYEDAAKGESL